GPALSTAAWNRRRASICASLGSRAGALPLRALVIGAASQIIVTRVDSSARSQSFLKLSPASNCRLVTNPLANSHPSGDSVRLTVTDRVERVPEAPSIERSTRIRRWLVIGSLSPWADSGLLPQRRNCRTE